jgi:carboxypeptidase Taq
MTDRERYDWCLDWSHEIGWLSSTISLMGWDQRTMLPPDGQPYRSKQQAVMARLVHQKRTLPEAGEHLEVLAGSELAGGDTPEAANIREWKRSYDKNAKVPEDLAVSLAHASSEGQTAWEEARPKNDWTAFKPHLEKLIDLNRERAEAIGYENEVYDALIDDFEPGETAASIEAIFTPLRESIVSLLERIQNADTTLDDAILHGDFPVPAQQDFAREVCTAFGYDFTDGRLDPTAHPFSTRITPGDVRITTRYDERDFSQAFYGVLHETGHALYSLGLPAERFGEPMGQSVSLGIHESQSRMWENLVGRSMPFWKHFLKPAKARFPALAAATPEAMYKAVNVVEPSLIRVEADEVTYNLHVMVRFELELALFRGELKVDELPEAWNEKMQAFLGVTPPDYASGVMQDVHWSAGMFGYFPTYTLGNLYAAQFFLAAARDIGEKKNLGDVGTLLARGEFAPLLSWLRENIHSHGMRYLPRELCRRTTGEELNPNFLVGYLEGKYSELYGF